MGKRAKIYTTVTDRYAPLHQTVIGGPAGEAIHALDGLFGHSSGVNVDALHVDGGVSDFVFATMALLASISNRASRVFPTAASTPSNRRSAMAGSRLCSGEGLTAI